MKMMYALAYKIIIKLMQSPHNINLRSHHSLKNSTINEPQPSLHLNPLSSRIGLTKKISLNSKADLSCNPPSTRNIAAYDFTNEGKTQYQSNGATAKQELFITLGNKGRDSPVQQGYQTGAGDVNYKIQLVLTELERHNRRLNMLEYKATEHTSFKQQISSKLNLHLTPSYPDPHQLKNEIHSLKIQLSKAADKKVLEQRIDFCEMFTKETALEVKAVLDERITAVEMRLEKMLRREVERIGDELQGKLEMFEQTISQYLEKLKQGREGFRAGKLAGLVAPLLGNSNLRLKFLSKVSLVELSRNPEKESQEEWEVESQYGTYMLDSEGFLLDESRRYIVDGRGECIQLSDEQIRALRGIKALE